MSLARINAVVFYLSAVAMVGIGVVAPAHAGLISSAHLLETAAHDRAIGSLERTLARDDVQRQLARFGVSQEMLLERARHLTDEELLAMEQNIESAVAGGDAVGGQSILGRELR